MNYELKRRLPFGGRFYVEHVINGRCAGLRPASRFDPGCSTFKNKPDWKVVV